MPALCAFLLLLSADCALTIDDLKWGNERAEVHVICDTPTEIHDEVKMFAVIWSAGTIYTDEDEQKLRYYSAYADAFFIVDRNAPAWTANLMPAEYGLNCTNRYPVLSEPTDVLPLRCPVKSFSETMAETMVRPGANYLGQASEVKTRCKGVRIPVCARPKSVPDGVTQWAKWDKKGKLLVNNDKEFADAAANADIIFVLDDKAPAESVYWFVKDPKELSCPGKPAPLSYDHAREWENQWFVVAGATLKRRLPQVFDWLFRNLSQTDGVEVLVSVGTFIERWDLLDKAVAEGGLGEDGKNAKKILGDRGLTKKTIDEAKALLKKLRKIEGPVVNADQMAAEEA